MPLWSNERAISNCPFCAASMNGVEPSFLPESAAARGLRTRGSGGGTVYPPHPQFTGSSRRTWTSTVQIPTTMNGYYLVISIRVRSSDRTSTRHARLSGGCWPCLTTSTRSPRSYDLSVYCPNCHLQGTWLTTSQASPLTRATSRAHKNVVCHYTSLDVRKNWRKITTPENRSKG